MKQVLACCLPIVLAVASCSNNGTDPTDSSSDIRVVAGAELLPTLVTESPDQPPIVQPDNIFLTVLEVQIQKDEEAWTTLSEDTQVVDFLELLDTVTVELADTLIPAGYYSQLRLILSDSNTIVIDGEPHALFVPSGEQTGIKLNLDVSIEGGETVTFYINFDEETAVVTADDKYILKPTYQVVIDFVL